MAVLRILPRSSDLGCASGLIELPAEDSDVLKFRERRLLGRAILWWCGGGASCGGGGGEADIMLTVRVRILPSGEQSALRSRATSASASSSSPSPSLHTAGLGSRSVEDTAPFRAINKKA